MRRSIRSLLVAAAAAAIVLPLCAAASAPPGFSNSDKQALRNQAPRDLAIGSAVWGKRDLVGYDSKAPTQFQQILSSQFSSLSPENDMKWDAVHPAPNVYDFTSADALVAFAEANHQQVRGHTLLWHSQNPAWVTEASKTWTCDDARAVLKDHIDTVVGHFKGKIYQWDVANEIFQDTWDNGGVRLRTAAGQNPFLHACAANPVALLEDAFRWAHAADPNAVLFLNDYNAEGINQKTDAYYALAKQMLADGAPLGGFGAQAHLSLEYPYDDSFQANLERFAALGLQVAITEADVRIPAGDAGPTAEQVAVQSQRYDALLQACLNVTACTSFTVWGFDDSRSWVPDVFKGLGWATIFTSDYTPKPAFYAMLASLRDATPGTSPRHG